MEMLALGQYEPIYRSPLDVQNGELPVLPLSIYGAVAMAHPGADAPDGTSSANEFFLYKVSYPPPPPPPTLGQMPLMVHRQPRSSSSTRLINPPPNLTPNLHPSNLCLSFPEVHYPRINWAWRNGRRSWWLAIQSIQVSPPPIPCLPTPHLSLPPSTLWPVAMFIQTCRPGGGDMKMTSTCPVTRLQYCMAIPFPS